MMTCVAEANNKTEVWSSLSMSKTRLGRDGAEKGRRDHVRSFPIVKDAGKGMNCMEHQSICMTMDSVGERRQSSRPRETRGQSRANYGSTRSDR